MERQGELMDGRTAVAGVRTMGRMRTEFERQCVCVCVYRFRLKTELLHFRCSEKGAAMAVACERVGQTRSVVSPVLRQELRLEV